MTVYIAINENAEVTYHKTSAEAKQVKNLARYTHLYVTKKVYDKIFKEKNEDKKRD